MASLVLLFSVSQLGGRWSGAVDGPMMRSQVRCDQLLYLLLYPPVRSSIGYPMGSHQEVSTSWDTRVTLSAPILLLIQALPSFYNFLIFLESS